MPTDTQVFAKWGEAQQTKFQLIDRLWPNLSESDRLALRLLVGTPYYHFEREANERTLLEKSAETTPASRGPAGQASPFGRESVGPAQESGNTTAPKCAKCGKSFTPKTKGAALCFPCWKESNPLRGKR